MKIAIVGATGLVGRKFIEILEEKNLLKNCELTLFASPKSKGKKLKAGTREYTIATLDQFGKPFAFDYALFSAGAEVSLKYIPLFSSAGTVCIDNSSAFRQDPLVPLVVPEINFDSIKSTNKIISNPNCTTIALVLALHAISKAIKIKSVYVTTLQAVSGAGKKGIDDLTQGTTRAFPYKIQDNVIPQIGDINSLGYSTEENKIIFETKKILNNTNIQVFPTCIRVPVTNSHTESVTLELETPASKNIIEKALKSQAGICLLNDNTLPMPITSSSKNDVFIGRLRVAPSPHTHLSFVICSDNIRKGASLNAIQILEKLIKKQVTT